MVVLVWLWHALVALSTRPVPCPTRMVKLDRQTCIDVFPFPNDQDGEVWLGLSAIEEGYLDLGQTAWDAETLCAEQGKRVCTADEWRRACRGTPRRECPPVVEWVEPNWQRVMARDYDEMARLDRHSDWSEYLDCVSPVGARMMLGNAEEWVRVGDGYAFSRGFWSREGSCDTFVTSHAPNWHDYATTTRCCYDL